MSMKSSPAPEKTEMQICLLAVNHPLQHDEIESLANAGVRFLTCGITMTPDEGDAMIREFEELFARQQHAIGGRGTGISGLFGMARGALDTIRVLDHLTAPLQRSPLASLKEMDPSRLAPLLQKQLPRTIAIVLSYMDPAAAAHILTALPGETGAQAIRELCTLNRVKPSELWTIDQWLRRSLSRGADEIGELGLPASGGLYAAVEILENVDPGSEKGIIDYLGDGDPELAAEIRKRLVSFEDIILFDNGSIGRIVADIEDTDIEHALKGCGAGIVEKVISVMPDERAGRIREEMDRLGPVLLREVEDAQSRIIAAIRALEESGDIVVARRDEENLVGQ